MCILCDHFGECGIGVITDGPLGIILCTFTHSYRPKTVLCQLNFSSRYIYIPLGGTKYAMYNIWVVFTFVALWHDISLKLLAWGWLISLFILPELIATNLFTEKKVIIYGSDNDSHYSWTVKL